MTSSAGVADLIQAHRLPAAYADQVDATLVPLADSVAALRSRKGRTTVLGVCGAQGSGKSTLCEVLAVLLRVRGLDSATLSLDDLYLDPAARAERAARIHPLFATRGPPGTHDVALGLRVLDALGRPGQVRLPRFDKGTDTRAPMSMGPQVSAPVDVVLFEGWCVGAAPQDAADLAEPVNALERDEDPDGVWRRAVNASLAVDYAPLFARVDVLVLIAAPDFDSVFAWRALQEQRLRERDGPGAGMPDAVLQRFIRHYERLTRHVLAEMPARADAVIPLARSHAMAPPQFKPGGRLRP